MSVRLEHDRACGWMVRHDDVIYIRPDEAAELAIELAKWGTNPEKINGHGVEELRAIARELESEADRRAAKS